KLTPAGGVFTGVLPVEIGAANTALEWAGVHWTMVTWPLPELRQPRERLLLHECFHRLQDSLSLPAADAVCAHLDALARRIWLQMEWRALERALRTRDPQQTRSIGDALLFRAYRRSLSPGAAERENAAELNEGLAEYTGIRLSSADVQESAVRADLVLRQARNNPTFARSFAYVSGPAYGTLLDLRGLPWRRGLARDSDLGELVRRTYDVPVPVTSEAAALAAAARYEGEEIITLETRRDAAREQEIAADKRKFVDGAVLVLPLSADVRYTFDPNNVVGIDTSATVYPTLRVVDAWGTLTVTGGACLFREPGGRAVRVHVPIPQSPAARPLEGPGWSLELKEGWEPAPGERPGDLVLRKSGGEGAPPRRDPGGAGFFPRGGPPPGVRHGPFFSTPTSPPPPPPGA